MAKKTVYDYAGTNAATEMNRIRLLVKGLGSDMLEAKLRRPYSKADSAFETAFTTFRSRRKEHRWGQFQIAEDIHETVEAKLGEAVGHLEDVEAAAPESVQKDVSRTLAAVEQLHAKIRRITPEVVRNADEPT